MPYSSSRLAHLEDLGVKDPEHFFADAAVGDGILRPPQEGLKPPRSSVACANIRVALRTLGYGVDYGYTYDDELADVVRRFQRENGHAVPDGCFGPGTRRLLTRKLIEHGEAEILLRMPDPENENYIFVSYKRQDMSLIVPFLRDLAKWGFAVWYDQDIPGGARWEAMVREKIAGSEMVVLFLSHAAAESKWVTWEAACARSNQKRTLVVQMEEVELAGDLAALSEWQMLDASDDFFRGYFKRAIEYVRANR